VQQLENYFAHAEAMPLFALPWWLEASIRGEVDETLQAHLMASGMHGYLFIRMLDDAMDGHEVDRSSLPALHLFSFHFQSTLFRYFPADHPFWNHFERSLAATAEAESADLNLREVSEKDFLRITSRKSAAALIPLAAVCCHYGRLDLLPAWEEFLTLFSRWHQMRDDVVDWSEDHEGGHATWILAEAQRRKAASESVPVWMGRTGLDWAAGTMDRWMVQIKAAAGKLNSPELSRYLDARKSYFSRQIAAKIKLAALYESLLHL
jgi:Polyprenyl synthetase